MKTGLHILVAGLLFIALAHAQDAAQQTTPPDYTALTGRWEGTMTIAQRGSCSINRSGVSNVGAHITLDVAADGSFTGQVGHPGSRLTRPLSGKFEKDLALTATGSAKAVCPSGSREYSITYSGQASQKQGRFRLKMEGLDDGCPEGKCAFLRTYDLKRK